MHFSVPGGAVAISKESLKNSFIHLGFIEIRAALLSQQRSEYLNWIISFRAFGSTLGVLGANTDLF